MGFSNAKAFLPTDQGITWLDATVSSKVRVVPIKESKVIGLNSGKEVVGGGWTSSRTCVIQALSETMTFYTVSV